MICIGVDDFIIVFVQYRDHIRRCAVPVRYSISMVATRMMDMVDAEHKDRRKPGTKYSVHNPLGEEVSLKAQVTDVLREGDHVLVVRKEEA